MVLTQYRASRVELDGHGMTLRCSPAPAQKRPLLIHRQLANPSTDS